MKQEASSGLISTRAAINLIVLCVLFIVIGMAVLHAPRIMPTPPAGPVAGPTTVTRINEQVIELNWNGTPQDGFVLSEALPMRVGDRIELFWLNGCLTPIIQEQCFRPWGALDVDPENRGLFRYNQQAYAIHFIHGTRRRESWHRGSDRMLIVVTALPLRLFFNTILEPGVYTFSTNHSRVRIPIDGYSPPTGQMLFRIVNRR